MHAGLRSELGLNNATLECYRRKRLEVGVHQFEIHSPSLYRCIDECSMRFGFHCRIIEYSSRHGICRFSSFDATANVGGTPARLVDDVHFDFYRFLWCKLPYDLETV